MTAALTYAEMRRYCRALVSALGLNPPLNPEVLCARLAESRGRPINLYPEEIPVAAAVGLLMAAEDRDLITYQAATTHDHQGHIVYHEVIHLTRDHLGARDSLTCGLLLPETDSEIGGSTRRPLYADWQEWEAETGATILSEWSYWDDSNLRDNAPSSPRVRRLRAALDDPTWD